MSDIERDVGQLLWIGFEGTRVSENLFHDLNRGRAGAVILFARNLPRDAAGDLDPGGLIELNQILHDAAPAGGPPLWIAVDQEGGRVQRVRAPANRWPPMLSLAAAAEAGEAGAEALAENVGLAMGRELALLGFDMDFAPVLDVHTNPANPIIGDRAFATEPEAAARLALAFARGLERAGVIPCGKHFPGHGDTDTDSHLELPRLSHSMERLRAVELVPFARAVAARIPLIMTAHVVFAALDPALPATLSPAVVTGLLRKTLGYDGIIVSDDLDMRAVADHFGAGEAAVRAIRAGCDALLLCKDVDNQRRAREALLAAARADSDLAARVRESAARIMAAKERFARAEPAPVPDRLRRLGEVIAENAPLAARLAAASGQSS